ncbi:hypothetical protein BPA30113_07524 [Burkholderia paludis]|uniref:Uncharacterized protein n=1 Tax=Burkholderia paludis TaxID=1506587 RepID=A0A6P2SDQ2_9BURK|nr:hypothetical protein LMG30113_07505 [Burkholderia paludis]VWC48489.1 hypothetical protein BPA30113_07524 [Burkholderia paludis]
MTQFRQFSNQGCRDNAADARHILQQLRHDGAVLLDATEHLGIDIVKLTGNAFEQSWDARACDRTSKAQALTLGESQRHKLASPGDQSHQIRLCGVAQRTHEALG